MERSSNMRQEVLIIIPAYNEVEGIRHVIDNVRVQIPYADILVINDGSNDSTGDEAAKEGVLVVNLSCNLGIGGAVQTGYQYAHKHGYRYAAQLDGDGQHNPCDFDRMLEELRSGSTDMIVGSRFMKKEGFQSTFSAESALICWQDC
ncbi:glycosyltransferase family 2 protein [Paenibacillus anaericanus]|uniref:glycosyltransferase family 2 protein n=1 Tax=Paenibacillus anaericanus TaxID=170367 RepID=UPI001FE3AEAD|nr:glycosyltransferase family 2 protein [Paenibacillus anaericanus]